MMLRRIIIGFFTMIVVSPLMVFAVDPANYRVEVIPDTFNVDEPVDLKISVLADDGTVISDYNDSIFISVSQLNQTEYVVPSGGIYTFEDTDQGVKLFSKGLVIKKAGEYRVTVEDFLSQVVSSASVIVSDGSDGNMTGSKAVVVSPQQGTVYENPQTINIIGTSEVPNTAVYYTINGLSGSANVTTDANGGYSFYITNFSSGSNTLRVFIQNAVGTVLASSDPLTFTVQGAGSTVLLKSFVVEPNGDHFPGDKVTVVALTDNSVTSAELLVNGTAYPLDKVDGGQFGRELILGDVGIYSLKLTLYVNGKKTTSDQGNIEVKAKVLPNPNPNPNPAPSEDIVGIGTIKAVMDDANQTTAHISWTTVGKIDYFLVRYGQNPAFLDKQIIVIDSELSLENLEPHTTTYVQVRPADQQGNAVGVPSDPLTLEIGSNAPPCVVRGVAVETKKIDGRYYLTWNHIDNVSEYVVYRSDFPVNTVDEMSEIGRTTLPSYPYPFDKYAEHDTYAYFAVEALCDDGSHVRVDTIKKVKVGPVTNILLVLMTAILAYFLWRLFALSKD